MQADSVKSALFREISPALFHALHIRHCLVRHHHIEIQIADLRIIRPTAMERIGFPPMLPDHVRPVRLRGLPARAHDHELPLQRHRLCPQRGHQRIEVADRHEAVIGRHPLLVPPGAAVELLFSGLKSAPQYLSPDSRVFPDKAFRQLRFALPIVTDGIIHDIIGPRRMQRLLLARFLDE